MLGWTIVAVLAAASVAAPAASRPVALPGALSGTGPRVVSVRVARSFLPLVSAVHKGAAAFEVQLVPATGRAIEVASGFSDYRAQHTLRRLAAGTYRLVVRADGPWRVSFRRAG